MADNGKVLINLATGMEDGERVLISLLVATAAQQQGKQVRIWATKDAVRLGLPDTLDGVFGFVADQPPGAPVQARQLPLREGVKGAPPRGYCCCWLVRAHHPLPG